jgi:hypothetical protein
MSSIHWRDELPAKVRALKIVVGGMIASCLVMFVVLAATAGSPMFSDMELVSYLVLGVALMTYAMRAIVPPMIVAAGRKKIFENLRKDAGTRNRGFDAVEGEAGRRLIELMQRKTVVGAAMVEGSVFLALIAYMLGHSSVSLAVAAVLLVLMALTFPSVDRSSSWIESQMQLLKDGF